MQSSTDDTLVQALVFPGFTTLDLIGALQPLAQMRDTNVEVVAKELSAVPTDCGVVIQPQVTFEDAHPAPDVLLVPGGGLPSIDVLEDADTMAFLERQGARAGWLVAVCTGTLLFGKAGLLHGYRAASHWAVMDTLDSFGAIPVNERVVVDRNRCTGGGVTAGVDIGLAVVSALRGEQVAKTVELILEYNPAPPFGTGHPSIADSVTLEIARRAVAKSMPSERIREIARSANLEAARVAGRVR